MMRGAILALAILLAACTDDDATVETDATTTSVDLSDPEPLPTVPTTVPTTPPPTAAPTTAAPATAPPQTRAVVATTRATLPPQTSPPPTEAQRSTYYANCSEARAAGAAPVHRGEPGYGSHLDRDGDGVGCE